MSIHHFYSNILLSFFGAVLFIALIILIDGKTELNLVHIFRFRFLNIVFPLRTNNVT